MRIVLQRVSRASVSAGGEGLGSIGPGLVALVGVGRDDDAAGAARLAAKTARLRIFPGLDGGPERSVMDIGASVLVVSQFTLLADTRRGNRPSWSKAAEPAIARRLVDAYAAELERHGVPVAQGRFGAEMAVELVNDGPVTIVLDGD